MGRRLLAYRLIGGLFALACAGFTAAVGGKACLDAPVLQGRAADAFVGELLVILWAAVVCALFIFVALVLLADLGAQRSARR